MRYYDRYDNFLINGNQTVVPFVKIPSKPTDKRYIYKDGQSRLDKISFEFYNTPYFGWLILSANPKFGGLEWEIPDRTPIVVPFPFKDAIARYQQQVNRHITLYG